MEEDVEPTEGQKSRHPRDFRLRSEDLIPLAPSTNGLKWNDAAAWNVWAVNTVQFALWNAWWDDMYNVPEGSPTAEEIVASILKPYEDDAWPLEDECMQDATNDVFARCNHILAGGLKQPGPLIKFDLSTLPKDPESVQLGVEILNELMAKNKKK